MTGIGQLMKQAQKMQEDLERTRREIAALEVEGESGAGLVRIVMTGRNNVRRVTLDPTLLQESKEVVEDLIAAAVNDAVRRVEDMSQAKMAGVAADLPLPPGFKMPF